MKFNICKSIPIKTDNIPENQRNIEDAVKSGARIFELQFDCIDNIQIITKDFLKKLLGFIQPKFPVIFSLREPPKGGKITINEKERLKILKVLIEAKPDYFEIEMNADNHILSEVAFLGETNVVDLIFSHYDFERTPGLNESLAFIEKFIYKLEVKLFINKKIINKSIYKVIFTAQKFEDNLIPIELLNKFLSEGRRMVSFCSNELGLFSRITCVKFGSFFTESSLDDESKVGQINIGTMIKIHKLLFEEKQ